MADCIECKWFNRGTCGAFPPAWPLVRVNHIRACVVAICDEYCHLIKAGTRVLEIGCGTWSPIRDYCQNVGALWDGIDIGRFYYGAPTIATRIESVEDLSFPDGAFDLVIGNQTFEHWNEFGCRPERGLWQCFRVCRVGGMVAMNVPIHFHGARVFVEGDLNGIAELFRKFSPNVDLVPWRRNSYPLEPVNLLAGYAEGNSYTMDIRAVRTGTLPPPFAPYRVRWRPVRELLDHRFGFLFWKGKMKIAGYRAQRES